MKQLYSSSDTDCLRSRRDITMTISHSLSPLFLLAFVTCFSPFTLLVQCFAFCFTKIETLSPCVREYLPGMAGYAKCDSFMNSGFKDGALNGDWKSHYQVHMQNRVTLLVHPSASTLKSIVSESLPIKLRNFIRFGGTSSVIDMLGSFISARVACRC